jgi:hypothetical protein
MTVTCPTITVTAAPPPCVPNWIGGDWGPCQPDGYKGRYETDGCGNTRWNAIPCDFVIVSGANFTTDSQFAPAGTIHFQISYLIGVVPYVLLDGVPVQIGNWASGVYSGTIPASPGSHNICVYDNAKSTSHFCANVVVT